MKIGILAPETSWHFQDLKRAANGTGHELVSLRFETLSAGIASDWQVTDIDGAREPHLLDRQFADQAIDLAKLDRVLVRTMSSGSLQQIVFRMDLLARLAAQGVHIINPPRAIEISIDKYLSLTLLAEQGIAVPPTYVAQDLAMAREAFERLGGDVVYKPIFGSMGSGITRLRHWPTAEAFIKQQIADGQVVYLQQFIEHEDWDVRVLVIGEDVLGMRRRRSGHWLTNLAQGGSAEPYHPNAREVSLARRSAEITGCEMAGVDLLYPAGSKQPLVVDVNAAPGWKGISTIAGCDIGKMILQRILLERQ